MRSAFPASTLLLAATLAACGGGGSGAASGGGGGVAPSTPAPIASGTPTPIPTPVPSGTFAALAHIVVIVQENRTFDNLFNGYPGADTVQSAPLHDGTVVQLQPVGLAQGTDVSHKHTAWWTTYDNGKLDAFDLNSPSNQPPSFPYAYVPQSQTTQYWTLAQRYTIADRMFQSNTGPSYPAHQYLIAAQSQQASENPGPGLWGCDASAGTTVKLVGPAGTDLPGPFPCFDYQTLGDLLDQRNVSWRYYAPAVGASGGIWSAYQAIRHIRFGTDWQRNVTTPQTNVLADIAAGNLAAVTWIVPSGANSDHAGSTDGSGPQWVASIVNAIGNSPFWNSTAILITWDDWGGWYDHVAPPQLDAMGLGYRVPLLVVSPYAKSGYVSHVQHEFGSIDKLIEERFALGSLGSTDLRADNLADCFNFNAAPRAFVPVQTRLRASDFARQAATGKAPDDDN